MPCGWQIARQEAELKERERIYALVGACTFVLVFSVYAYGGVHYFFREPEATDKHLLPMWFLDMTTHGGLPWFLVSAACGVFLQERKRQARFVEEALSHQKILDLEIAAAEKDKARTAEEAAEREREDGDDPTAAERGSGFPSGAHKRRDGGRPVGGRPDGEWRRPVPRYDLLSKPLYSKKKKKTHRYPQIAVCLTSMCQVRPQPPGRRSQCTQRGQGQRRDRRQRRRWRRRQQQQ